MNGHLARHVNRSKRRVLIFAVIGMFFLVSIPVLMGLIASVNGDSNTPVLFVNTNTGPAARPIKPKEDATEELRNGRVEDKSSFAHAAVDQAQVLSKEAISFPAKMEGMKEATPLVHHLQEVGIVFARSDSIGKATDAAMMRVPLASLGAGSRRCPSLFREQPLSSLGANESFIRQRLAQTQALMSAIRAYFEKNLPDILTAFDKRERRRTTSGGVPTLPQRQLFGHPQHVPAGKNRYGQLEDRALWEWVDAEMLKHTRQRDSMIPLLLQVFEPLDDGNHTLPLAPSHATQHRQQADAFACPLALCGPYTRASNPSVRVGLLADADDAMAKAIRYLGSLMVENKFTRRSLLRTSVDCVHAASSGIDRGLFSTGFIPSHFPPDPILRKASDYPPLTAPPVSGAMYRTMPQPQTTPKSSIGAAAPKFPLPSNAFNTKVTKFRQTAWIGLHNVCGMCEWRQKEEEEGAKSEAKADAKTDDAALFSPTHYKKGYMHHALPCALSLYSVGPSTDDLHQLQASKHKGRNDIYFQREAGFQYNGHVERVDELLAIAEGSAAARRLRQEKKGRGVAGNADKSPSLRFINGTTILVSSFAVNNVGHAIHDGLWGLTETLLIGERLNTEYYCNETAKALNKHRFEGVGGSIATLQRPPTNLYKSKRTAMFEDVGSELVYLFPDPIRVLLGNQMGEASGRYYRDVALTTAESLVGRSNVFSSPFDAGSDGTDNGVDAVYCFETLVAGGVDRELKKGHYPFADKESVAKALRSVMNLSESASLRAEHSERPISVFVYGRNDVHRRSIDNIGAFFSAVALGVGSVSQWVDELRQGSQLLRVSPSPTLVTTFSLSTFQQIRLASATDILVTVQGAHMQSVMLFMPPDGVIIEIGPCGSGKVSFLKRYGPYLPTTQRHVFMTVCGEPTLLTDADVPEALQALAREGGGGGAQSKKQQLPFPLAKPFPHSPFVATPTGPSLINFSENDLAAQNITLCPMWLLRIQQEVQRQVGLLALSRGQRKNVE